jgi:hypothetical protein
MSQQFVLYVSNIELPVILALNYRLLEPGDWTGRIAAAPTAKQPASRHLGPGLILAGMGTLYKVEGESLVEEVNYWIRSVIIYFTAPKKHVEGL